MNNKHPLSLLVMMAVAVVLALQLTAACSCIARVYTPAERLAESEAVFVGTVASINEKSSFLEVEFMVDESFKGINEGRNLVYTYKDSAGCGYNFEEDEQYLVIVSGLDEDGTKRLTSLCDGNLLLSQAQSELPVYRNLTAQNGQMACTKEAKICPDGSAVGRNSSNFCAFDPCSPIDEPLPEDSPNFIQRVWRWFTGLFS